MAGEADRLKETHPDQAEDIRSKQAEIENNWRMLKAKVRKETHFKRPTRFLLKRIFV